MELREATVEDLPVVLAMAHDMKRQLAAWAPQYFRPHRRAARGDIGLVVVCAADDDPLRSALTGRSYRPEVDLFALQ